MCLLCGLLGPEAGLISVTSPTRSITSALTDTIRPSGQVKNEDNYNAGIEKHRRQIMGNFLAGEALPLPVLFE